MTRRAPRLLAFSFLALAACTTPPMPPPSDAMPDAEIRPPDTAPATFTLEVPQPELEMERGQRLTLEVRIVRTGGFAEPVLVELAGLPDTLGTLARESRPGDEITTITIRSNEDGDPIPRSAFVVQATTFDGLRHVAAAHITVR